MHIARLRHRCAPIKEKGVLSGKRLVQMADQFRERALTLVAIGCGRDSVLAGLASIVSLFPSAESLAACAPAMRFGNRPCTRGQGRGQVRYLKVYADFTGSYWHLIRTECPLWVKSGH